MQNCDIRLKEYENFKKDCLVFKETNCINDMLGQTLEFKRGVKRIENKIVNYSLYLIAHNGFVFDLYVVLNNLRQWRTSTNLIKEGAGIASPEKFEGYIDKDRKLLNMYISNVEECISTIFSRNLLYAIDNNLFCYRKKENMMN